MSPKFILVLLLALVFHAATSIADDDPKPPIIGKPKPPHRPPFEKPPHKPPTEELSLQEQENSHVDSKPPHKKPPPKHKPPATLENEVPVAAEKPYTGHKPPVHPPPKGGKPPHGHYPGHPQMVAEEGKYKPPVVDPHKPPEKKPPVNPYKPPHKPPAAD